MPQKLTNPILFYDGQCGLCDRSVRWVMRRDRQRIFRFAPLQGQTYRELDISGKPQDLSTMVVLDGGRLYTRSDGVLRILRRLGGP
jgi:predicted DCC family thiol-disulfide oxidoreductase YuxK